MPHDEGRGRVKPDWSCCALHRVTRFLRGTLDYEEVVEEALATALEVTGSRAGLLLLTDGPKGLRVAAARHLDEGEVKRAVGYCRQAMDAGRNPPAADLIGVEADADRVLGRDQDNARLCLLLEAWSRPVGALYLEQPGHACLFPETFSPFFTALADQLACALENASRYGALRRENERLRQVVEGHQRFAGILGESAPMRRLKELLEKVIASPASVLILGESGTGKELVARALHYEGPRRERSFVAENCAALPESLLEGELFGFSRGAFTGAVHDKPGLLEVADGGTLFLDEIADTSPAVQAKLLRVLENGEYRRLGETEVRRAKVRVLAATSRDLVKEVEGGRFRPELYYRLGGLAVQVPSLRERPDDIPLLTRHFLTEYGRRTGRGLIPIEPSVTVALQQYTWPGNVRQLRNEVERMAALADEGESIALSLLSPEIRLARSVAATRGEGESLTEALERIKRTMIEEALVGCTGNRSRAATRLGISRPNLQKMMRRLDIR